MKLSFSTRGWGDLSWDTLLDTALEMKFTGIEVYNLFCRLNLQLFNQFNFLNLILTSSDIQQAVYNSKQQYTAHEHNHIPLVRFKLICHYIKQ